MQHLPQHPHTLQIASRMTTHSHILIQREYRLNMEVDLQSLFGLHIPWCAQLYSLAETPQLPSSPRIRTRIRGRYWSAKIDDISLQPPERDQPIPCSLVGGWGKPNLFPSPSLLSFLSPTSPLFFSLFYISMYFLCHIFTVFPLPLPHWEVKVIAWAALAPLSSTAFFSWVSTRPHALQ